MSQRRLPDREIVSDFIIVCGGGALVYGLSLHSQPIAWCVGGVLLMVFGWLVGGTKP